MRNKSYSPLVDYAIRQGALHLTAGFIKNYYNKHTKAETIDMINRSVQKYSSSNEDELKQKFIDSLNNNELHKLNMDLLKNHPEKMTPLMRQRYSSYEELAAWRDSSGKDWRYHMIESVKQYFHSHMTNEGFNKLLKGLKNISIYADTTDLQDIFDSITQFYPTEDGDGTELSEEKWMTIFEFAGVEFKSDYIL